jgi:hypothetical protein
VNTKLLVSNGDDILKKNIYEIFGEHIREHMNNKDKIEQGISPMSGVCPYCTKTMYRIYKDKTGKDWKVF